VTRLQFRAEGWEGGIQSCI